MDFENSKLSGSPHRFLAQLSGGWTGTSPTWLDPTAEPYEAPIQSSIQPHLWCEAIGKCQSVNQVITSTA